MNRLIFFFLMLLILIFVQTTFLSRVSFFDIKPDLVFVFLILWAARCGPLEGLVLGLLAGWLMDSLGPGRAVYLIVYPVFSLAAGFWPFKFISGRFLEITMWVFGFSLAAVFFEYFCLRKISGLSLHYSFWLLIVSAALNALAAPLIFPVFFWGAKK